MAQCIIYPKNFDNNDDAHKAWLGLGLKDANLENVTINDKGEFVISKKDFDLILDKIDEKMERPEGLPFPVDFINSINIEDYRTSITDAQKGLAAAFVSQIEKELKPDDSSVAKLNDKNRKSIISHIFKWTLPTARRATKIDMDIHDRLVIQGDDPTSVNFYSENELSLVRFNIIVSDLMLTSDSIFNSTRKRILINEVRNATIVSSYPPKIVFGKQDFNLGILSYMSSQYNKIVNYLKDIGEFDSSLYPDSKESTATGVKKFLIEKRKQTGVFVINPDYVNTLRLLYNILQKYKSEGSYSKMLENGWIDYSQKRENRNRKFYEAVSAFINLQYFEASLKDANISFIKSVSPLDSPIDIDENGVISYKYDLAKGNSNQTKSWSDKEKDALDMQSNFAAMLQQAIPIVSVFDPTNVLGYMQPKLFMSTFALLRAIGNNLDSTDLVLVDAINTLEVHTELKLKTIYDYLFSPGKNGRLLSSNSERVLRRLIREGFDRNYLNFLYSVYKKVFDTTPKAASWANAEKTFMLQHGIQERYNLVDTIISSINGSDPLNYLLTIWDNNKKRNVTVVKDKYLINSTAFDTVDFINGHVINNTNRKVLLDKYPLIVTNYPKWFDYRITLGNNTEILLTANNAPLLKKNYNNININVNHKSFDFLNFNIDQFRINREANNLTAEEIEFNEILKFIDDLLGLNFLGDDYGIIRLKTLIHLDPNTLKDLIIAAARALNNHLLYYDFETAVDADGKPYSDIVAYLDGANVMPGFTISVMDNSGKRQYVTNNTFGVLLSTVNSNDELIIRYSTVIQLLSGDTVKSVISDLGGNKIPNYSPSFLGARILREVNQTIKDSEGASKNLLFTNNSDAIEEVVINYDIKTLNGTIKSIKTLTLGELFYDAIINKFIDPIMQSVLKLDKKQGKGDSIYVQSTTYSDKTKFVEYKISLEHLLGKLKYSDPNFNNIIISQIQETIGKFYKDIYDSVLNDYSQVFSEFVKDGALDIKALLNKLKSYSQRDLMNRVNQYNAAHNSNIEFVKDLHYRQTLKGLSFNELLYEYSHNLYGDINKLTNRIYQEKIRFAQQLMDSRTAFKVRLNSIMEFFSSKLGYVTASDENRYEIEDWVLDDYWVIGIVKDSNGKILRKVLLEKLNLKDGETFELNPFLDRYFMIDTLVANNLRFQLTGHELNHAIKALKNLNPKTATVEEEVVDNEGNNSTITVNTFDLYKNLYSKVTGNTVNDKLTIFDLGQALSRINPETLQSPEDISAYKYMKDTYDTLIFSMENLSQNAQLKRNVIIPGTIRPYLIDRLNGIGRTLRISVVEDISADVFNFTGDIDRVSPHDGAAFENPFTSFLENWSLQDGEVGFVKKPIQHSYSTKYGYATLLKYSIDTITNEWMRLSDGNRINKTDSSGISLELLLKKMTNYQWRVNGSWKFGKIDLINGALHRISKNTSSYIHFRNDILQDDRLFYRFGDKFFEIINFDADVNQGLEESPENYHYYTEEFETYNTGNRVKDAKKVKYYHYFKDDGTYVKSRSIKSELEMAEGWHTINSIYELYKAMGGIYSMELSNKTLLNSEISNKVVAKFINNVTTYKGTGNKKSDAANGYSVDDLTQNSYDQPLKKAMIDVIVNNSAIKNGAANVNEASAFTDDSPLSYLVISTSNYGIQLDADHEANEATMTEFSLVISSLDAGGRNHEYVKEIYEALAKVALEASKIELNAVELFRNNPENKSKLYDVVARTIISNYSKGLGNSGLANAIVENLGRYFNLNENHARDKFLMPFSDINIYNLILPTFVSIINKKSIKRKYSGSGEVMVPSFNLSMIYDIDGTEMQYEDLIKLARRAGYIKVDPYADNVNGNIQSVYQQAVLQLLNEKLRTLEAEWEINKYNRSADYLNPVDNIKITFDLSPFNLVNIDTNEVGYEIEEVPTKDSSLPFKTNTALNIYLKDKSGKLLKNLGYFLLKADRDAITGKPTQYYSVHFKTGDANTGKTFGSTLEQRLLLYKNIYAAIPRGALVSTWGNVSEGGNHALNKLMQADNIVGTRMVKDRNNNDLEINVFLKFGDWEERSGIFKTELNAIADFYSLLDNPEAYLAAKGFEGVSNIRYYKDISRSRNLKPAEITYDYVDDSGITKHVTIFNHWKVKNFIKGSLAVAKLHESDKLKKLNELHQLYNVQSVFDDIARGVHVENGKEYKILNLRNEAAEMIGSNLYKSKFLIRDGDSMVDVLNNRSYFYKLPRVIDSLQYDIALTSDSEEDTYITFKPVKLANYKSWNNIYKERYVYQNSVNFDMNKSGAIYNRVFAMTSDNRKLFEVGREVISTEVRYDSEKHKFVDKATGRVVDGQSRYSRLDDSTVLKYIEFVLRFNAEETTKSGVNKFTLYNINDSALSECYENSGYYSRDKFKGDLLSDIYHSKDFSSIQFNKTMTSISANIVEKLLPLFKQNVDYDDNLVEYLTTVLAKFKDRVPSSNILAINSVDINGLNRALGIYHNKLADLKYINFKEAQYVTASRIPAQTLQSFMKMKNVGFTGTDTAQVFVSHWQMWLQGSDYDIDKAYIMGLSFNNNGRFVGWSSLFNYSSTEALQASMELPIPNLRRYSLSDEGLDIESYVQEIKQAGTDKVQEIKAYNKLIRYLNQNALEVSGRYLINWKDPYGIVVKRKIEQHENTKIPPKLKEEAIKNYISTHIQGVIQNPRSMVGAYSPIAMDVVRSAADQSPKGQVSASLSLMNPLTKFIMQYLNMTGKNVIGIAANGEKASFMWHYYLNDAIRSNDPTRIERAKFEFTTKRVHNRHLGNPSEITINRLPEMNFEGVSEDIQAQFNLGFDQDGIYRPLTVDLIISQILSAATDNAKELILAKINAGNKLAKMYLFMITLGYDIRDLVSFMTSDVANFINDVSESNLYGETFSVKEGIELAYGNYEKVLSNRIPKRLRPAKKKKMSDEEAEFADFMDTNSNNNYQTELAKLLILNYTYKLEAIPSLKILEFKPYIRKELYKINMVVKQIAYLKNFNSSDNEVLQDIDDFKNIFNGANAFSNLGTRLGMNQGIGTDKESISGQVQKISDIYTHDYNLAIETDGIVDNIDASKYLVDPGYRQLVISQYDKIKYVMNTLDIVDTVGHFSAIDELLAMCNTIDNSISIKSKIYDKAYDILKNVHKMYIPVEFKLRLLNAIDEPLILEFLKTKNLRIPIRANDKILTETENISEAKNNHDLTFEDPNFSAKFKFYFENVFVPNLKLGIYNKYMIDGSVLERTLEELKTNRFLTGLTTKTKYGVPFYKLNMNILLKDSTEYNQQLFLNYLFGLNALNQEIDPKNNLTISDMFMLYNLIVNKNRYGADNLTTIFLELVSKNNSNNLIKQFDAFIGKLDYYSTLADGDVILVVYKPDNVSEPTIIDIDIKDLLASTAVATNYVSTSNEPLILTKGEDGVWRYMINSGYKGKYDIWKEGNYLTKLDSETDEEYNTRILNKRAYWVIGNDISNQYKTIIDQFINGDNISDIIFELMRKGVVELNRICK